MNDSTLQWLTTRASAPGMLACGLRQPDGNCVCHSIDETFPPATMEKILPHFENLAADVFSELTAPRWSTWAFEHGQIRFVKRPDGWCLALIIRAESEASPALDSLSLEFLSAPLENG
jgi:hypothetical protein